MENAGGITGKILDYVRLKKPYVKSFLESKAENYLARKKKSAVHPVQAEKQEQQKLNQQKLNQVHKLHRQITLDELLSAYRSLGVVGEEKTIALQTICALHGLSFGIEGPSGSGKSRLANALMRLMPEDSVYSMELSSKTAEMYNCDKINNAKIIYIPELQKLIKGNQLSLEMIKNITEGRDVLRRVKSGNGTVEQKISADKTIIYTLATENQTKKDYELSRRFLTFYTDPSEEQTRRIMEYLALEQFRSRTPNEEKLIYSVREHSQECMGYSAKFINPFAYYILEQVPDAMEMRTRLSQFYKVIAAHARFNFKSRYSNNGKTFITCDDVKAASELASKQILGVEIYFNYVKMRKAGIEKMKESGENIEQWEGSSFLAKAG